MGYKEDQKLAQERLKAYQDELRKKKVMNSLYLCSGVVSAIVLYLVFASGQFNWLMGQMGVEFAKASGVYADCSKPENKKISYCQPKESQSDHEWKSISHSKGSKHIPFNLF